VKKFLSLVVLGALVIAACGGGSTATAAMVDGETITVGDVEELVHTDGATLTKEQFAQFLAFQIQWIVIGDSAEEDYDVVITDEEVAAEADRIYEEVAAEDQTREDFLSERGVTEAFLEEIARQGLIDIQVREILLSEVPEPTQEEIDAARVEAQDSLLSVCASHILVDSEESAADILTRLEEGEAFGDLAAELGTDGTAQNEGSLGCASPATYVEPFAEAVLAAPIGEVYDEIVETQFGFHVILVTDRQEPSEEDLPTDEEIIDGLKDEQVISELENWFLSSVEQADVTVEEEYGTWQPNPPTVVPPVSE
jgi:foldase protein PrsA